MSIFKQKGTSEAYEPYDTRRDVRRLGTKLHEALLSPDSGMYLVMATTVMIVLTGFLPFGG